MEPAISWEEEKAQAQDMANADVTGAIKDPVAVYEPESNFAFLAEREPDPDVQAPLSWEEQKLKAQDPFASEITKEAERQVRQYGEIKEYGLGKNWFERTVIYAENMYHDAAHTVKDTWEKLMRSGSKEKDSSGRDDRGFGR